MVSIILPVFNASAHLQECIDSVLAQTYTDYELLVMDDGSTDNSVSIAEGYEDERVRVVACEHNFIQTLNRGIEESRGKYIARMDADDLMMPERLEKQVGLMESFPSITVCSSAAQAFGLTEEVFGVGYGNINHPLLSFLLGNFVIHPSVMIRKDFLTKNNLLYKNYPYAEDYKLWMEIGMAAGKFYVIPTPLIKYRISENQVSNRHRAEQNETALSIRQEILDELLARNQCESALVHNLYDNILEANQKELIDADAIFSLFYQLFERIFQKK
ncbi:MAG: glycosyltransferase [Prevotella sp.]|nr:glycosyltransferase [Prevotella sp.]